eukprot:INCI16621.2.p2 GENE.INCI16621.2~~INCI16621.2.p2  ORF type:complete len:111 (-),score=16.37 INCI16621.2:426-758(-)
MCCRAASTSTPSGACCQRLLHVGCRQTKSVSHHRRVRQVGFAIGNGRPGVHGKAARHVVEHAQAPSNNKAAKAVLFAMVDLLMGLHRAFDKKTPASTLCALLCPQSGARL